MKRIIILILSFIILSYGNAFSALNIDLNALYTQGGDLENLTGVGGAITIDLVRNLNVFVRSSYNQATKNSDKPDEENYTYIMYMGGVQYLLQISDTQLFWSNSAAIGAAAAESEIYVNSVGTTLEETGMCVAYWTGLLYNWTQHISPYIEIGYHKAFYSVDFEDADVSGFQFIFGVRFTLFGKNRGIGDEY